MQCAAAAVTHEMVHFRAEARKDMHQLLQQPQQPLLFHIPLSPLRSLSLFSINSFRNWASSPIYPSHC